MSRLAAPPGGVGGPLTAPRGRPRNDEDDLLPIFVWELLIIAALIVANGFFAAAEIAIIAARRGRLEQLAKAGDRAARTALELAADPNRFLPTVQVGITLVSTFAAAFGGAHLSEILATRLERWPWPWVTRHAHSLALTVVVLGIAFCSLVIGELVPKRLALGRAERLARLVALPMHWLSLVARPAVWCMGLVTDGVLFFLGGTGAHADSKVSLEDIQHLIKTGAAEGVFEPAEQKVALEALKLSDHTVKEIMRPRMELDALDVETPPEELIGTLAMAGFSRLPVYEGDLDHILGFVHFKDLFRHHYLGWPIELRKLLRPALFVPETLPLDRLLERFQQQGTQLAVVLDEFGGTEGVVTLEDVVSELVGEIRDEHARDRAQALIQRDSHSWLVDGRFSLDELIEKLGLEVGESAADRGYSTVAGLVLEQLGRIPVVGDRTRWLDLELEVVDMDGQRIDRVMFSRQGAPPADV